MFTECASESEVSIQMVFDVCLYVLGIPYLLHQSWRNKRISIHDFDPNGDLDWSLNELFFFVYKNLNTVLSLATVCFLVGSLADRTRNGVEAFWDSDALRGREQNATPKFTELQCLALVTIFMYCNLLHMLLPFQSIGPVLITIWRMLMGDVVRWIIVYFFLLMAFSQAIIIAVQDTAMFDPLLDEILEQGINGMSISKTSLNTLDFVKYYVLVTLGDVSQPLVWQAGKTNWFIWMMHILFLVLSTLLLLNLIIAMMGETYAREKSNEGAAMWSVCLSGSFAKSVLRVICGEIGLRSQSSDFLQLNRWMMKAWRVIDYETQLPRDKKVRSPAARVLICRGGKR